MNIIFYSTNSNWFSPSKFALHQFPRQVEVWKKLHKLFPGHSCFVVAHLPAMFLLDGDQFVDSAIDMPVRVVVTEKETPEDIANEILLLKPDVAIAASFWVHPYDWLSLQDSMVGEILSAHGIRVLCTGSSTALCCFDKWQTHQFLQKNDFAVPKTVYVHHELFWAERGNRELRTNVYKQYVLHQLQELRYPVIIKDTTGVSSYSLELAVSYKQAVSYLASGRTRGDRLVQEYLEGPQYGVEVYGSDGKYSVFGPFLFSLNRYGVTSPKQSVKLGPVPISASLREQVLRLSRILNIQGCAQYDVIYSGRKWYIIEVNPRLSGMSESTSALLGLSPVAMLLLTAMHELDSFINKEMAGRNIIVCNLKIPLCTESQLAQLYELPFVHGLRQIQNMTAKQEREKGYGELILAAQSPHDMLMHLKRLQADFPDCMEPSFVQTACTMTELL